MYRTLSQQFPANNDFTDSFYVPGKLIGFAFNVTAPCDVVLLVDSNIPSIGTSDVFVNGNQFRLVNQTQPFYCALNFELPVGGNNYRLFCSTQSAAVRDVVWYYEDSPLLYR